MKYPESQNTLDHKDDDLADSLSYTDPLSEQSSSAGRVIKATLRELAKLVEGQRASTNATKRRLEELRGTSRTKWASSPAIV